VNRKSRSVVKTLTLATAVMGGLAMVAGAALPAAAQTAAPAPSAPAATGHTVSSGGSARAYAIRLGGYWTASRMRSARSLDSTPVTPAAIAAATAQAHPSGPAGVHPGAPARQAVAAAVQSAASGVTPALAGSVSTWTGSQASPPATTSGKVFFTDHLGGKWQCSGSAVNSNGKDTVFTAGHCVYGTAGGELPAGETWHSNWMFVPDYNDGSEPFGQWPACQLWTLINYFNSQDWGDDIGAGVACTNASGQHLVNVVGGQGFAWNFGQNLDVFDFGYPSAQDSGLVLQECDGTEFAGTDFASTSGIPCNFTEGSSGGPWLAFFGGTFGDVNGVNSFTDSNFPGYIFSPYFGNNADNLFNAVANL
jgi:hypothetical protein